MDSVLPALAGIALGVSVVALVACVVCLGHAGRVLRDISLDFPKPSAAPMWTAKTTTTEERASDA